MNIQQFVHHVGEHGLFRKKAQVVEAPTLKDAIRFPYGPFRFTTRLPKGIAYTIQASTDLQNWTQLANGSSSGDKVDYVDSDASKFSCRFYRLTAGGVDSANVIGYVSVALPPGFSMISNPLAAADRTVGEMFKGWPDGTTLARFDTRFFRLMENEVKFGKWTNPDETLAPGEGAIFFNPTSDYKSWSFVGEVRQGNLSMPIPSGFSIRSSLLPQAGSLEDLGFPATDGDVIHLFDRDRQKYVLHPHEGGRWTAGPPVVSVGESFWVAKTEPGNWSGHLEISSSTA